MWVEKLQVESQGNNRAYLNFFFYFSGIPVFLCLLSNMLKSIVSYILIGLFIVICGRVNMVLIIPSQNFVLFYSELLIISDLLASSIESGIEWVIHKWLLDGQVGGVFYIGSWIIRWLKAERSPNELPRSVIIKENTNNKCWWGQGWMELLYMVSAATVENSMKISQKTKNIITVWPRNSTLWVYIFKNLLIWKCTCIPVFKVALSTIAKIGKQLKCLSTDKEAVVHIYSEILLSH